MSGRARQNSRSNGRRLKGVIQRVEQSPYQMASGRREPRPSAGDMDLLCQLSGSLGPATGTWPSITATSTTADVYTGSGTSISKIATAATIYNRRNVTWAASKTTYLKRTGGGFAIIDQDC